MQTNLADAKCNLSALDEEKTYTKVTWRLIPFLCLCFVIAFIDRVNISFAKLQMSADLGFSETVYGLGAGIFFLAYFVFEVPSNLIMHKVGARRWIARILITWSILTGVMAFTNSATMFYIIRFLIGAAEAGFFPGIVMYLTCWFPLHRRGKIVALFMTALPIAGVIGGILSGWVLETFNGVQGLSGWEWLFILEAIPSLAVGIAVLYVLDDSIAQAKWLAPEEKHMLSRYIEQENQTKKAFTLADVFRSGRIWVLSLVFFGSTMGHYGLGFWLPSIIRDTGVKSFVDVGLLSAIPYAFGIATMILVTQHSDKTGERRWHYAIAAFVGAAGLVCAAIFGQQTLFAMVALTIACMGLQCLAPIFWTFPTAMLSGIAAAAGIALINSVGNLAGFVSPYMVGLIKDHTGTSSIALFIIAFFMVLAGVIVLSLPKQLTRQNRVA